MQSKGSQDGQPLVTAADVSRYAGVTRATVSNWRRRHPDFPAMTGGTEARPLFDFSEVKAWLKAHDYSSAESPLSELRALVQTEVRPEEVAPALTAVRVEAGQLTVPGQAQQLTEELSVALRAVAAAEGPLKVLEVLAERATQGSLESGQYWTPQPLAALMARLLVTPGADYPKSVFDPACGRGGLLIEAARLGASDLHGQDAMPVQAELARLSLALETGTEHRFHTGDSLRADGFPNLEADAVLCNPPVGQRDWGADELAFDSRWVYGEPLKVDSELAWLQHGLAHLRPGGTAVFMLPPAVASRTSGRRIRAALLRTGALRAVVALPNGTVPWTPIALQLWVLRRPVGGAAISDRVLFVEPTPEPFDQFADRVVSSWRAFDVSPHSFIALPDVTASVPVVTLLDDLVDLSPSRHTRVPPDPQTLAIQVDELLAALSEQADAVRADIDPLRGWTTAQPRQWRSSTLSDLAHGGSLKILRTVPRSKDSVETAGNPTQPVLSAQDIVIGERATTPASELATTSSLVSIAIGDVLLPQARTQRGCPLIRVADARDAGAAAGPAVLVLRPNLERLDPWFLAGFATWTDSVGPSSGSTIRTETNRIRIPLLPLPEQRGYGAAFRRINELREAARQTAESANALGGLLAAGLAGGSVNPPIDDEGSIRWTD
ncbi:N-6 DNA methylase [Nocardia sp. NPDC055029]